MQKESTFDKMIAFDFERLVQVFVLSILIDVHSLDRTFIYFRTPALNLQCPMKT